MNNAELADLFESNKLWVGGTTEPIPGVTKQIIAALRQPSSDQVLPCEFVVGAGHFNAGVKVETAQGAVNRMYEHMQALECELGRLCWHCKSAIYPGEPRKMFNPAPSAASGGTWVSIHETCPVNPLKAFQDRISAAEAEGRHE